MYALLSLKIFLVHFYMIKSMFILIKLPIYTWDFGCYAGQCDIPCSGLGSLAFYDWWYLVAVFGCPWWRGGISFFPPHSLRMPIACDHGRLRINGRTIGLTAQAYTQGPPHWKWCQGSVLTLCFQWDCAHLRWQWRCYRRHMPLVVTQRSAQWILWHPPGLLYTKGIDSIGQVITLSYPFIVFVPDV